MNIDQYKELQLLYISMCQAETKLKSISHQLSEVEKGNYMVQVTVLTNHKDRDKQHILATYETTNEAERIKAIEFLKEEVEKKRAEFMVSQAAFESWTSK